MAFFRQYLAPLIAVIIFLVALVVVSARAFLPAGLSGPAPIEAGILPINTIFFQSTPILNKLNQFNDSVT